MWSWPTRSPHGSPPCAPGSGRSYGPGPSGAVLDDWGVGTPRGPGPICRHCARGRARDGWLVKCQAAFYERHGWRGFRTLQRLIGEAQSAGMLVIVDAKRGDVGSTNDAYAEAYLGAGPIRGRRAHRSPVSRLGAMGMFVSRAHDPGVACSCDPLLQSGGPRVQSASIHPDGRSKRGFSWPSGTSTPGWHRARSAHRRGRRAAHIDPPLDLVAPQALFLAPGVGAQAPPCAMSHRCLPPARPRHAQRVAVAARRWSRHRRLRHTAARLAEECRDVLRVP